VFHSGIRPGAFAPGRTLWPPENIDVKNLLQTPYWRGADPPLPRPHPAPGITTLNETLVTLVKSLIIVSDFFGILTTDGSGHYE
jgi:hypothetical protein